MLFWTRACLCIGTVTVMAVGRLPPQSIRPSLPALAVPTAALVGEACRARPDLCAAAVTGGLGALRNPPEPPSLKPKAPRRADGRGATVALGGRSLT